MSDGKEQSVIIKKYKKKGGGAHGGSWKVAYADFVTAMMAFFLLMWLLNMTSAQKKIQLSQYFQNYSIFEKAAEPPWRPSRMSPERGCSMPAKAESRLHPRPSWPTSWPTR
jgi:chemotaxis protein MotB